MTTLAWIISLGVAMAAIAMVGSVTLVFSEKALDRLLIPLVALAAGSLLGGVFLAHAPRSNR